MSSLRKNLFFLALPVRRRRPSVGLAAMTPERPAAEPGRASRRPERLLLFLFLLSLPFVNPWVRGDGVGYYAYARALLVQHNLDFTADYQHANSGFRELRLDANGEPLPDFRTSTGHLDNHFSIGPALLWTPALAATHAAVLLARTLGSTVPADGFSLPYRLAMAFTTAVLGFLALLLAFRIVRNYVEERWALLSALAVWGGTSLLVYMYFNPSWSHAQSAFAVALFFWYWLKTRQQRSTSQWLVLGALAGLMIEVYYVNAVLLAVLLPELLQAYLSVLRASAWRELATLLARHAVFAALVFICLLPTFVSHYFIYGSPFSSGYIPLRFWDWKSPYFAQVLFSSNHGLLSWTPLVALSFFGLLLFLKRHFATGLPILLAVLFFYYVIASYPDWNGISSFGNRFFISLTVFFVLGLGVLLEEVARKVRSYASLVAAYSAVLLCFVLWNLGLMFQWGAHLVPPRGPVSWSEVVHNQFMVLPRQLSSDLSEYLFHRRRMMNRIEQRDAPRRNLQDLP